MAYSMSLRVMGMRPGRRWSITGRGEDYVYGVGRHRRADYAQAAQTLKRVSLELVVSRRISCSTIAISMRRFRGDLRDIRGDWADLHRGVRVLVQNSIRESSASGSPIRSGLARKGDPMLLDTNIGPVTTAPQYRKILEYIEIAKAEGARCILGGGPAMSPDLPGGQFVEPTISSTSNLRCGLLVRKYSGRCSRSWGSRMRRRR